MLDKAQYIANAAAGVRVLALPEVSIEDRKLTLGLMLDAGAQWIDDWGLKDTAQLTGQIATATSAQIREIWLRKAAPGEITRENISPRLAFELPAGQGPQYWKGFLEVMKWTNPVTAVSGMQAATRAAVETLLSDLFDVSGVWGKVKAHTAMGGWWVAAGLVIALAIGGRK